MELPKLNFRDFILASIMIVVLLSMGFFFLLEKPRLDSIAAIKTQQATVIQEVRDAEQTLKRLEAAKKESAEVESKLIKLSKKMPEDAELASLIIELQELATEAGMELVSIKPAVPVVAGEFSELKLDIQMTGFFFDTVDFLYRLENFPREIKTLVVTLAEGGEGLPQLTVSLTANTYILTTGQAAASPPAALPPAQAASPPGTTEGI